MVTLNKDSVFERISLAFFILEIFLISWLCSGVLPTHLFTMLWCAILSFVPILWISKNINSLGVFYKNPLFWSGIILCSIGILQSMNPVCEKIKMGVNYSLDFPIQHFNFLPHSIKAEFDRGNVWSSISKILTATLFATTAFVLFKKRKYALLSLIIFALNCTAMGIFGIIQKLLDTPIMYDNFYSLSDMYGTFFYGNAASAFLSLGMTSCLALTLIKIHWSLRFLFFSFALICAYASCDTESFGGISEILLISLSFSIILLFKFFRLFLDVKKLTILFTTLVILSSISLYFLSPIISDYKNTEIKKSEDKINHSICSRLDLYKISYPILKENLIWGVGGGCYGYYADSLFFKTQKDKGQKKFLSLDETHSDFYQYLIEYGLIGGIVIAIGTMSMYVIFFIRRKFLNSENIMLLSGITIFIMHTFFDWLLQIPSTMLASALILTLAIYPLREYKE